MIDRTRVQVSHSQIPSSHIDVGLGLKGTRASVACVLYTLSKQKSAALRTSETKVGMPAYHTGHAAWTITLHMPRDLVGTYLVVGGEAPVVCNERLKLSPPRLNYLLFFQLDRV
jgi:hypothetical protein